MFSVGSVYLPLPTRVSFGPSLSESAGLYSVHMTPVSLPSLGILFIHIFTSIFVRDWDLHVWGCVQLHPSRYQQRFVSWHNSPPPSPSGPRPPYCRGLVISLRHTTFFRTPLDEWSARRRGLYLTTHHSEETDIHDPGEIRTCNPSEPP